MWNILQYKQLQLAGNLVPAVAACPSGGFLAQQRNVTALICNIRLGPSGLLAYRLVRAQSAGLC